MNEKNIESMQEKVLMSTDNLRYLLEDKEGKVTWDGEAEKKYGKKNEEFIKRINEGARFKLECQDYDEDGMVAITLDERKGILGGLYYSMVSLEDDPSKGVPFPVFLEAMGDKEEEFFRFVRYEDTRISDIVFKSAEGILGKDLRVAFERAFGRQFAGIVDKS